MRPRRSASSPWRAGWSASVRWWPRRNRRARWCIGLTATYPSRSRSRRSEEMAVQALTRDSMPKGEGDFSIEGHGMEPIPETARYGAGWRLFTVWFTPNLVPAAFAIGIIAPGLGLGFLDGLLAIIAGNLIGAALVG